MIAVEAPYALRGAGPSLVILDRDYKPVGCRAELHVDYRLFPLHAFSRRDLDLTAEGLSHNYSGPGAELHWFWDGATVLPPHRSMAALRAYRRRLRWVFGARGLAQVAELLERELGDLSLWEKPVRISCATCGGIDSRGLCARCGRCNTCSQRYVDGDPAGETCFECLCLPEEKVAR